MLSARAAFGIDLMKRMIPERNFADMKLSDISSPAQLRACSPGEMRSLAAEIRRQIIHTVDCNGGHLASNLGVVELTLALHRAFDCPRDKLIFDVGHQCYAHKLLTGRFDRFATLRQLDGMSGFPQRAESPYDAFGAGHASTALSAALGMARARDLQGESYQVVAVVGDGALTGGMCYEALNDAGSRKTPLILVLNDNGMSISRNVGALSAQLTRLRLSRGWLRMKQAVSDALRHAPVGGERAYRFFQRIKNGLRNILVRDKFFTSLGFRYLGPIDGHDMEALEKIFRRVQALDEPAVIHVVTRKGAGYQQAEERPDKYHGVSPQGGEQTGKGLGTAAGEKVLALAQGDHRVCVVTAAMTVSTGFGPFVQALPERLFDVGIAEEHAVTMACGMAAAGMRPFVAIYETFLQRGLDQLLLDACLQRLPVCFLMDRAGVGGEDGATHHGLFGPAFLRPMPGLTVLCPRDEGQLHAMIDFAMAQDGPVAIRYGKAVPAGLPAFSGAYAPGQWETLRAGTDGAILCDATLIPAALFAADAMAKEGMALQVIHASSYKPLDEALLSALAQSGKPYFTLEEAAPETGLGGAVAAWCAAHGESSPAALLGLPDAFIPHGSRALLLQRYGLDGPGVFQAIRKAVHP